MDKLFHDMMGSMSASGFYQGAVMSAISGIEMALWDITGQACGVPIWQLLGGKFRDRIRIYNDCHAGDEETPEAYAEKARAVEARGFDAIKFDIDPQPSRRDRYNRTISNRDVAYFVDVITALRESLDSNTDLLIDAHWNYAPVDILKVAYAIEDLNLMWLEDPVPPENIEAMAKVTQATRVPHLHRGELLHPPRFPGPHRGAGGGHHLARPRQGGGPAGGPEDRRPGGHVLHPPVPPTTSADPSARWPCATCARRYPISRCSSSITSTTRYGTR